MGRMHESSVRVKPPAGDLAEQFEQYRSELTAYCYRMLASPFEAEDAVQDTFIRAWRGYESFEGRAALRSWLYRIATNVCLDMLAGRERRARPMDLGPAREPVVENLNTLPEVTWLEPIPDPAEVAVERETIKLAFVAALQHLPPKQRAVLILCEVLRWKATEVAELLARYVEAFEQYDMDALTSLISEDAKQSMPPFDMWLAGRDDILSWWVGPGNGCRGSKVIPTIAANGSPAFAQYKPNEAGDGYEPWALQVLEIEDGKIVEFTFFLDTERVFPLFGVPLEYAA
jgi:RNA polymerase sigma-70 factor (ECF subfamily)